VKDFSVAGRYARALFIVTERRQETVTALADLKAVRDVLTPGSRVSGFLGSPEVRMSDKRKFVHTALDRRSVLSVVTFIDLLLRKKRLNRLSEIAHQFEALVETSQGIRRAHVVSAVPLTDSEQTKLHSQLEIYTRSKVKLTSEVDAALLGGALVRIGDRVIDRSVRTMLDRVGTQLQESSLAITRRP